MHTHISLYYSNTIYVPIFLCTYVYMFKTYLLQNRWTDLDKCFLLVPSWSGEGFRQKNGYRIIFFRKHSRFAIITFPQKINAPLSLICTFMALDLCKNVQMKNGHFEMCREKRYICRFFRLSADYVHDGST